MTRSRIAAAALASTAFFFVSPAFAVNTGTDTGTIAVSLTVVEECLLATEPLAFGTTGVVDANVETSATITVECTRHSPYQIGLSAGDNDGGSDDVDERHLFMTGGVVGEDLLSYQLYSDSGFSSVWGHTIGTDTVGSSDATGLDEEHEVYARVPTHQNGPAGSYTDTITATIWYAGDLP
jgi:spore coat protein U-like protein